MNNPVTDHEQYCAATQAFFDDIDSDSPDDLDIGAAAMLGAQQQAPPSPDLEPAEDPVDADADEQPRGQRLDAEDSIDLDGPDRADEPPSPLGDDISDDHGDVAENPQPASDLVDQLSSADTAGDDIDSTGQSTRAPRYNKNIAAGFAAITVAATVLVSAALLAMRSQPHTNEQPPSPNTRLAVAPAPSSTTPAADNQDSAIPYTATAVGCLPGSTAAQSVAGPDSTQAWVCVTGGNVGQFLVINLGRTMVVTAVSITPGWVGADASGADQWHQHRVLTRVQWSFNDTPPTAVPQETGAVHGEATKPMPASGVLASRIVMLVQETGRAPADTTTPTTTAAPGAGSGFLGEVLGPPAAPADPAPTSPTPVLPGLAPDSTHTDPADNTFAVSSIKIFGHSPLHP
ncbi:hypothetical protein ACQI5H_23125 [Mycobacterium heidelbergense]|uniref:hypothetical protein n=1 Tax=Mycobacterium heidelbergense TaxID=53376 RepID=UPI003CFB2497